MSDATNEYEQDGTRYRFLPDGTVQYDVGAGWADDPALTSARLSDSEWIALARALPESPMTEPTFTLRVPCLVAFSPRSEFQGRPMLPELEAFIGHTARAVPAWIMGDKDMYPGEYALVAVDGTDLFGRAWIASGDVTIVGEAAP